MKKKEAIQKGIEDLNYQSQKSFEEQKEDELQKRKDDARPALLKRIAAGIIDFLIAASIVAGIFLFSYFVIYPSIGYQDSSKLILDIHVDSGLFIQDEDGVTFYYRYEKYNEGLTPEENYDVPVSKFYSSNPRAIQSNELEKYIQRKLDSTYYELDADNNCVRKEEFSSNVIKPFLEKEYRTAVSFLYSDPEVINANKVLKYTTPVTLLIGTVISSAIFYFAIPLIDKKGRTIGYIVLRLIPVSSDTLITPDKSKLFIRSLVFFGITYLAPISITFWMNGFAFAFIPFFINVMVLAFSHSNSGLHDYASRIIIINQSYSNALSSIKAMAGKDQI